MADAADEVVGIYRRHAEAWTRARGTELPEVAWLDGFSALLPPGGSVLDLGCGSGVPVARDLARRGLSVTGVDSAPEMIAMFRANLPTQRAHVADMRVLALDQRFSGVVAWDSFFHLTPDDQRAMFPIFAMHGEPGAALLFTSGPQHGEVLGVLEGDSLYHASLSPEEYRLLLRQTGFEVRWHLSEDPSSGGRTVWLAQKS